MELPHLPAAPHRDHAGRLCERHGWRVRGPHGGDERGVRNAGRNRPTARCRVLGRDVRVSGRHGKCDLAEPALRPVPNALRPFDADGDGGLRGLCVRRDRRLALGARRRRADRPSRSDARRGGDDDGGGGRDRGVEGPAWAARGARDHRGVRRACSRNCHHLPHRATASRRSERVRPARSNDRNVGEHRRPGSRSARRWRSGRVDEPAAHPALRALHRARRARARGSGGRSGNRYAELPREGVAGGCRHSGHRSGCDDCGLLGDRALCRPIRDLPGYDLRPTVARPRGSDAVPRLFVRGGVPARDGKAASTPRARTRGDVDAGRCCVARDGRPSRRRASCCFWPAAR